MLVRPDGAPDSELALFGRSHKALKVWNAGVAPQSEPEGEEST